MFLSHSNVNTRLFNLPFFTRPLHMHSKTQMHSSDTSSVNRHFTITYRTPDDRIPVTTTYQTVEDFHKCFQGWGFTNTKTRVTEYAGSFQYGIDPTVIYDATHPHHRAILDEVSHNQISNKAFEEKAIKGVERHLQLHVDSDIQRWPPQNPAREDGWRFITAETDIAEWEGIWQGCDGHVYLLEAKHVVTSFNLGKIETKLQKTLAFLKVNPSMATVYVAGKYWADGQNIAVKLGFGIIQENGMDLTIEDPSPKPEVDREGESAERSEIVKRKGKGKGKKGSGSDKLKLL